jgi:RNA polymerase sigma-70 factor (ECF subfamily)
VSDCASGPDAYTCSGMEGHSLTELREPRERIDAIRRRDADTLESVARENLQPLLRAARAAGLSTDEAYDAVQETMLVFVAKAHEFDGRAKVRTWLFGILFRKVAERRRAFAREEPVDEIDALVDARFDQAGRWIRPPRSPAADMASDQAMAWLEECLQQVPERRRTAFLLREVEQLDTDEVCNVLGVTPNNLGVLLFRARNALRECLELKGIRGSADVAL